MFFINNNLDTDTRYDIIKFFDFKQDNIDPLDSCLLINILNLPEQGIYTILNEEKRPDLLSYNLYQDTQYWWILLLYNSILNVNELKSGITIRYPSLTLLEKLYTELSIEQKAS